MSKLCKVVTIIFWVVIVGWSHAIDEPEVESDGFQTVHSSFTGTIIEINGSSAIVNGKLGGSEGKVFVSLSVNPDETFRVGDEVEVGYDGMIMESNPAQINTLSVELIQEE